MKSLQADLQELYNYLKGANMAPESKVKALLQLQAIQDAVKNDSYSYWHILPTCQSA